MRIRSLQTHLLNHKLILSSSIEQLQGKRIGVDAISWMRTLSSLKDPFADALGGPPAQLFSTLDRSLLYFQNFNISPLFVFDGIQPRSQIMLSPPVHTQIDEAWKATLQGDILAAQQRFAQVTSRINSDLIYIVSRYLQCKNYDTFQAPYLAISQLAYFAQEGAIDAVLSVPTTFLFGIPRVIIGINQQKDTFEWIDMSMLLKTWNITQEKFVDACLLTGIEYCFSCPYFAVSQLHSSGYRFQFGTAIDFVKQTPLTYYLQHFTNKREKQSCEDKYSICKTLIKYPLALNFDGKLRTVVRENYPVTHPDSEATYQDIPVPENMHKILGYCLPNTIYLLMSRYIISRKLPSVLATGEWLDHSHPTIDSVEYRELLKEVREYRCRALGLIASRLHHSFREQPINFCRYACNTPHLTPVAALFPNCHPGLPWSFTETQLEEEMKRQNVTKPSFSFCLNWHEHTIKENQSLLAVPDSNENLPDGPVTDLSKPLVALTTLHFMVLENIGFFSQEGGATQFGIALASVPHEFQEHALLALELMKRGDLMIDPLEAPPDRPFPEVSWLRNPLNAPYQSSILLLGRLASLIPLNIGDVGIWHAFVDFDLAAFHTLLRLIKRSLRLLTEACIANLLLKDLSYVKYFPLSEFDPRDPHPLMFTPPRNCTGIVFKYFLEFETEQKTQHPITNEKSRFEQAHKTCKRLERRLFKLFQCCRNVMCDLFTAIKFWLEMRKMIQSLSRNVNLDSFKDDIEKTHQYLVMRIYQVGLDTHMLFQHNAFTQLRKDVAEYEMNLSASTTSSVAKQPSATIVDESNTNGKPPVSYKTEPVT